MGPSICTRDQQKPIELTAGSFLHLLIVIPWLGNWSGQVGRSFVINTGDYRKDLVHIWVIVIHSEITHFYQSILGLTRIDIKEKGRKKTISRVYNPCL